MVLRALQLGRRQFSVPTLESDAHDALNSLPTLAGSFEKQFLLALAESGIGSKFASQVEATVLKVLGVHIPQLGTDMVSTEWEIRPPEGL